MMLLLGSLCFLCNAQILSSLLCLRAHCYDLVFQVNFEALRPYMERSDLKDTNPPLLTNAELVINFAFNQKAPHRCATRSFRGQGSNSKRRTHETVSKEDTACEYRFSDPLVEYNGRFTDIVASVDQ